MFIIDQLKRSDSRVEAVAVGILLGMAILFVGLWYVQIAASKRFVKELNSQSFRSVRVPGIRGQILDRNRLPLAENRATFNVNVYLEELRVAFQQEFLRERAGRKLKNAERMVLGRQTRYQVVSNMVVKLSGLMREPISLNFEQFQQHYERRLALPFPVLTNLAYPQVARFLENSAKSPGLELEVQPTRTYPYKTTAAHLLGYVQRRDGINDDEDSIPYHYRLPDYQGKLGLEAAFDDELRGRAGVKSVLVNSLGYRQSETPITPTEPGQNLVLTIDRPLQQTAEKALRSRDPNERGAAIVMDPRTGDILAMVSNPAYDPNAFVAGITLDDWERLSDPKLRPQINRATAAIYPPGSIFKIITGLAGLEAGTIDPSVTITNPGYFQLGSRKIVDLAPPGEYNFHRALLKSSNYYFIHFGLETGLERILSMGARFHLGESGNLPTRQNERGRFPTPESIRKQRARGDPWTDGDTANLCIGQGEIAVTPLQMAVMTAAIANGGKVFWPRLVQHLEAIDESGERNITRHFPVQLRSELGVQPRNLEIIREGMRADVQDKEGTGRQAEVAGMEVCGKTGTAEVKKGQVVTDRITWFASFAPYRDPRYVVLIVVESGASGGGTCGPMAQMIYRAIQERENPKGKQKPESLAAAQF